MSSQESAPVARLLRGLRAVESALDGWPQGDGPSLLPHRERIARSLRRVQRMMDAVRETAALELKIPGLRPRSPRLLGVSTAMRSLCATIERIGPRESNVLIQGESGTGKELVARALHFDSPRKARVFLSENCAAIPEALLESELFGHRRGSFTGASVDRVGLLEEADGGTLFLDELANASPAFQTRLLRVLQEREVRRVGENQVRPLSLRVVAATSGQLRRLMAAGRFREDLFYRLNVLSLDLPPLRQRREDIPVLLDHFLEQASRRHGLPARRLHQAAREILLRYHWPGNVRELANVLERAALLSPGAVISPEALPGPLLDALLQPPTVTGTGACAGKSGEQLLVERALLECGGDRSRAARLIGWHRGKLYRRLHRYGIPRHFGRDPD